MPTYDYQCTECKHTFEVFQAISAPVLVDCPACKRPSLKRMISGGAGIVFKGSGFYLTDYKKSHSSSATTESSASKSSTETSSSESPKPSSPALPAEKP